ncbi:FixH family protein [Anianabacter salinae]|uniref:FixH family protein n=1 Tax=Anianabacter salinae TaxID=2851023 RepID=UPI00225DF66A|nr:FixH family protein [Anianabacter salinae]MBV0910864.1 FixH family protein [Anianabacter salinae]
MTTKPLTGRTVLFIAVSFFGVIIAVNLTMAFKAVGTFPGLEVKNSYVASQSFDAERAAQEALGWTSDLRYSDGLLRVALTGKDGKPVEAASIMANLGRATEARDDRVPGFAFDGAAYVASEALDRGNWVLHVTATAADGTPFRQRLTFSVAP